MSLWFASDEFCCSEGGKGKEEAGLESSGALLGDGVEGSGVEHFMGRGNVSECSSWFLCGSVPLKDVFSLFKHSHVRDFLLTFYVPLTVVLILTGRQNLDPAHIKDCIV